MSSTILLTAISLGSNVHADEGEPSKESAYAQETQLTDEQIKEQEKQHQRRCPSCDDRSFSLNLALPLWMPLMSFTGESKEDEEEERKQLLHFQTALRFGIVGQVAVRLGPIELVADAFGAALGSHPVLEIPESDTSLGLLNLAMFTAKGAIKWRIDPLDIGKGPHPLRLAFHPYVGGRYVQIWGSLVTNSTPTRESLIFEEGYPWGEPMIGAEWIVDPYIPWSFRLALDVGGFGLGSDISVWTQAQAAYHFNSWLSMYGGWTVFFVKSSSDKNLVESLNFIAHGPTLALQVSLF